jgi:hypothetical protein
MATKFEAGVGVGLADDMIAAAFFHFCPPLREVYTLPVEVAAASARPSCDTVRHDHACAVATGAHTAPAPSEEMYIFEFIAAAARKAFPLAVLNALATAVHCAGAILFAIHVIPASVEW